MGIDYHRGFRRGRLTRRARTPTVLNFPEIDPVAISIGPVAIRWYGIAYIVGIGLGWWLGRRRAARDPWRGWTPRQVDDVVFFLALGAVLGGRIGYVLFYDFPRFISDPLVVVRIWEGGMSFHGGLLGVIAAAAWFARRHRLGFFVVSDFFVPLIPPGLGFGRIANFVNAELWGRPSDLPWAMVFPGAGPAARHPSQLYEAALEGLVLFAVLWWYSRRPRPRMAVSGLFLLGYGAARCVVEFAREPDAHIGYLALDWVTAGQLLSVPMLLAGAAMLWWGRRARNEALP